MEPASLTLGEIAAALVAKAADKTAERAVEGGAGVLKRFAGWLQERFSADDERDGATALVRLEDAPDSPSRLRAPWPRCWIGGPTPMPDSGPS